MPNPDANFRNPALFRKNGKRTMKTMPTRTAKAPAKPKISPRTNGNRPVTMPSPSLIQPYTVSLYPSQKPLLQPSRFKTTVNARKTHKIRQYPLLLFPPFSLLSLAYFSASCFSTALFSVPCFSVPCFSVPCFSIPDSFVPCPIVSCFFRTSSDILLPILPFLPK